MSFEDLEKRRSGRAEVFSSEEVRVLLREYAVRRKQLKNPEESLIAWLTIASHVSAVAGNSRSVEQCRQKVVNLKINSPRTVGPQGEPLHRQPLGHCLFCSQPVDLERNLTLTEDLILPLCQLLQLKSTRVLNFEQQLLHCSLCPNCHWKTTEAQLAIDELTKLQERIQSISTAIENYIVIGVQRTDERISNHAEENTDSLSPTKLRISIAKALKLGLSTHEPAIQARSDVTENDDENFYGDDFQEISFPNSPEVKISHEARMEQSNNFVEADNPTIGNIIIHTGIYDGADGEEIPEYKFEDTEAFPTEENIISNLPPADSNCKDPLEYEIFGAEDSTEIKFRNKNFTRKETKAFIIEYEKRKAALEGPGPSTSDAKSRLWEEIALIVSSIEGVARSSNQCMMKLKNLRYQCQGDISKYLPNLSNVDYEFDEPIKLNVTSSNIPGDPAETETTESELTRKKSKIFSNEEVKCLLVEYEKGKTKLDGMELHATNSAKHEMWEDIASMVSSIEGIPRSAGQCKIKLKNLRKQGIVHASDLQNLVYVEPYDSVSTQTSVTNDAAYNRNSQEEDFIGLELNKSRNKNFTPREIKTFLVEYEKRKVALECAGSTTSGRNSLWTEIANIVGSIECIPRNVFQYKQKLKNLRHNHGDISEYLQTLSHIKYGETTKRTAQVTPNYDGMNKRLKSKNFSQKETKVFLVEYLKRKDTIEDPCLRNPEMKLSLWKEIATMLSSVEGRCRTVEQCKIKLKNLRSLSNNDLSGYLESLSNVDYDEVNPSSNDILADCSSSEDEATDTSLELGTSRRSKNFTPGESKTLLVEYEKRKASLKGPFPINSVLKSNIWKEIASIVSSVEGIPRSIDQCKVKLRNIKPLSNGDLSGYLQSLSYIDAEHSGAIPNPGNETIKNKVGTGDQELPKSHRMKTREENFTPAEVRVLMTEYKNRKADIEKNPTDLTSWNKIVTLVSAQRNQPRTIDQCKKRVAKELDKPSVLSVSDEENLEDSPDANSDKCDDEDQDYEPTEDEIMKLDKRRSNLVRAKPDEAFSPEESATLISEYTKRKYFLETAPRTHPKAQKYWRVITRLVSSTRGVRRTPEECRQQIRTLEHQATQREASYRKSTEISRTGLVELKILKLKLHRCDGPNYKQDVDLNKNLKFLGHKFNDRYAEIRRSARARHLKVRYTANAQAQMIKSRVERNRVERKEAMLAKIHQKSERMNNRFKCTFPKCKSSFKQEDQRNYHYKRSHRGDVFPFKCVFERCGKAFRHAQLLEAHAVTHTGQQPFKCDTCQKCFSNKIGLRDHKRLMHELGVTQFHCSTCNRYFLNKHSMRKHVDQVHKKERPFLCELCSRAFSNKHQLQSHQVRLHPENAELDPAKFTCDECGKVLCSSGYLKVHKLRHRNALPYPCTFAGCSFQADRPSNLSFHMVVHTGERNFKCTEDKCDKTFKKISQLRKHLHRHAGTGFKICPHCDKKCADSFNLQNHIDVIHFPDLKKHFCESCGEGFPIRKYLNRHKLICAQGLTGTSKRHGTKRPAQD